MLAALLLLTLLGAALLFIGTGWLARLPGGLAATATGSTLPANSTPQAGQTARSTPHSGATSSELPTPAGTSTVGQGPTATNGPGPTATSGPRPTATSQVPQLEVTPLALNFTLSLLNCLLQNQPQTLTVQNIGAGDLNWQATIQNSTYLTISQGSGHLSSGQMIQISVSFVCQTVVVHASDPITFTSNGGGTVVVSITITLS